MRHAHRPSPSSPRPRTAPAARTPRPRTPGRTCRGSRAAPPKCSSCARPVGGTHSCGRGSACSRAVQIQRTPDPRHEVAPVVEMEMRDHDRLDASASSSTVRRRPSTPGPQSRSTVPGAVDEVAGVGAARVRPGGRAADDGQIHARMLSASRVFYAWHMADATIGPAEAGLRSSPGSAARELSSIAGLLRARTFPAGSDGRHGGPGRRRLLHHRVRHGARERRAARKYARSAPATTSARSR